MGFLVYVTTWVGEKMVERASSAKKFKSSHPLTPYAKSLWEEQMAICATTRYDFKETGPHMYLITNVETHHTCEVTWDAKIEST